MAKKSFPLFRGHGLFTVDGEMMVTVVGEIPIGTAERIALSVRGEKKPVAQP